MHTIKLQIHDTIYDHIMFLLKNLNAQGVKIIEDQVEMTPEPIQEDSEVQVLSNNSANLVEDWKDENEDAIWK